MNVAKISTKDGVFIAHFSMHGLSRLDFPLRESNGRLTEFSEPRVGNDLRWTSLTQSALDRVLAAKPVEDWPPLDLSSGTEFQQSVWRALRNIPLRQTMSYGEVAKQIGRPKALRAVGQACGANPIPVLIPCHRVLAAHGKIGGFSSGLDWKRKLLEREGIRV